DHQLYNEVAVNTPLSEFAAYPEGDRVFYVGEPTDSEFRKVYGWTGNAFLRVYTAGYSSTGQLTGPSLADESLNGSGYHVGPVSRAPSGALYVTRTYVGREGSLSRERGTRYRTNTLELYIYQEGDDGWVAEPFPYNNVREYSVGHATL